MLIFDNLTQAMAGFKWGMTKRQASRERVRTPRLSSKTERRPAPNSHVLKILRVTPVNSKI